MAAIIWWLLLTRPMLSVWVTSFVGHEEPWGLETPCPRQCQDLPVILLPDNRLRTPRAQRWGQQPSDVPNSVLSLQSDPLPSQQVYERGRASALPRN